MLFADGLNCKLLIPYAICMYNLRIKWEFVSDERCGIFLPKCMNVKLYKEIKNKVN